MSQTIGKYIGEGHGKGEVYAALAYNPSDAFGGMQIKGVKFSPVAGIPAIQVGDSTTAWTALYGDRAISIYSTCADTGTGNAMPVYIKAVMAGIGGLGRAIEAVLDVNARLGSYSNAIKGYIDFTGGSVAGLGSAICAEMLMGGASMPAAGNYAPLEIELVTPTGWTGVQVASFIHAQVSGDPTAMTAFGTTGYLMNIVGVADVTSGVFHNFTTPVAASTYGLKILVSGVPYDILLVATQN